ncbi:ABC transporter ATP-binding protein [Candidatus Amarolinea aalborgensis]|uniref:ABC transporter ATP-binding protein n=1 Tax=Candidatus Amarolinea aalborgensis TaxID=2249329 RepID=UPI003BF9A78D
MAHGNWWAFLQYDETKGKAKITPGLLRRVAHYARPYWVSASLMLVTIAITSALGLAPPLLYRDLIDNAIPNRDMTRLNWLAVGMIAIPIVSGLISVWQRFLSASVGEGIIFDLRQELYAHMQRQSLRFFTNTKTGELMSRLNNDVVGAQNAVTGTLVNIVTNVIGLISTLIIMISLEWRLTILAIAIFPLFLLPTRRVGVILRDIARRAMEYNANMNTLMNETLNVNGALLVKLFGRQADEVQRFGQINANVRAIGVRRALIGRWFFLGLGIVGSIGTALVFWWGGRLVLQGAFTVGTIVAFVNYLGQLYGPISSLANVRVEFETAMVSFERVFEYLDLPVEIADRPGAITLPEVRGHVRFEHVSFSYGAAGLPGSAAPAAQASAAGPGPTALPAAPVNGRNGDGESAESGPADAPARSPVLAPRLLALDDISFEVKPGQLVALVGPSGAGKTTITYLLPRLYDCTAGQITLDGYDLRDLSGATLAQTIGMVTQESYLFHDTVRTNLLYARPQATQAELEAACRAANIHDFILSLKDGYDTIVGERGYRFSGGEKQRLAMARVLLKNPTVLILDEATSHLDSHSEALIQEALQPLMRGRTSLVIAHRLSTILAADLILVMNQGRLVEQGTHQELLAQNGLYASLYETQFRQEPA